MADVVREINRESGAVGGGSVAKTLEISVVKVGVSGDVARTMTIDFGQLQAQPTWGSVQGKPTFANVAFSGSYNDLTDKPVESNVKSVPFDISTFDDLNVGDTVYEDGWCASVSEKSDVYLRLTSADSMSARDIIYEKQNGEWVETTDHEIAFGDKANKPQQFVEGHVATFDENGNLEDGGAFTSDLLSDVRYNSKGYVLQKSVYGGEYTDIVGVGKLKEDMGLNMILSEPQVTREEMGVANGVATLDAEGKVPQSQLPNVAITIDGELSATSENPVQNKVVKAAIDAKYTKPSGGIPSSDIASGVIPDVSAFITKSVNDLTNYYLKSETYTKAEVAALIGAIQQFHYEIYPTLPQTGQSNVLYLIGPTGSGSDRYEEYVYANSDFTKIGDTSIDLSGYVTTSALNTALADYTTTANLTTLLAGKQDTISDLATIRSGAALGATAYQKPSTGIPSSDLASGVIPQPEVFWATYGTTTYSEISQAVSDNKLCIATKAGDTKVYVLGDLQSESARFYIQQNQYNYELRCNSNDTWQTASSGLERVSNKVTSLSSSSKDNQYPSAKAVADAIGKWGVVSQTQTWTQASDGSYAYVMSNLVYGLIPNYFIDLVTHLDNNNVVFNESSGYFELNELTDISYNEMQQIYSIGTLSDILGANGTTAFRTHGSVRTVLNIKNYANTSFYSAFMSNHIEIIAFNTATSNNIGELFSGCEKLKKVLGRFSINVTNASNATDAFKNCYSLESIVLRYVGVNISFAQSSKLDLQSIVYMVENANNTSAITITLHADAYARCQADATEYTYSGNTYTGILALATAHNITIASAS